MLIKRKTIDLATVIKIRYQREKSLNPHTPPNMEML